MGALVVWRDLVLRTQRRRLVGPISGELQPAERVALVGSSGSGKSLLARATLGCLPEHIEREGACTIDGGHAGAVFQDARASLNPLSPVWRQIAEPLRARGMGRDEATRRVYGWLERLGFDDAPRVARLRPVELSGGQRQRVAIALAMIHEPALLIADEPTSALDRQTSARVLGALSDAVGGVTLLFITHDLSAAARVATRTLVMDAGQILEDAATERVANAPTSAAGRALARAATELTLPTSARAS